MTKLTCIIVDDEPLAIRLLRAHVEQVLELELAATFERATEGLAYLHSHPVDLVFLDIQMPVVTGLEFARSLGPETRVIFTTAYRDYAVESYELNVVDYLVKPITFARFYRAVGKVLAPKTTIAPAAAPTGSQESGVGSPKSGVGSRESRSYRFFNANKKHVRLALEDITHVESLKDYLKIHTAEQAITTRGKISEFATTLPDYFLRTHRSFIVSLCHVTAYTAHDVEVGDIEVPIGASYKVAVMERLGK